jgi:hypothetical protein
MSSALAGCAWRAELSVDCVEGINTESYCSSPQVVYVGIPFASTGQLTQPQFRVVNGILQVSYNDGITWTDSGAITVAPVWETSINALQVEVDALQDAASNAPPLYYRQDFSNTNTIQVNHNMGQYPAVYIEDTGGNVWMPKRINHITLNTLDIQLDTVFSGTVFLS